MMVPELTKKTNIICFGIMTNYGSFYTEQAIRYGTNIIAGVHEGKGGVTHLGIPIFNTLEEALKKKKADACIIHFSGQSAVQAIMEALDCGMKLIICTSGSIPTLEMLKVKERLASSESKLIGPSSLGILIPGECRLGVIPTDFAVKGDVGLISRHGSLTFEVLNQIKRKNLGISTCISLGSEILKGMEITDAFDMLNEDKQTKVIIVLANISGFDEENFALHYASISPKKRKPVIIYMAGSFYDFMGKNTYQEKVLGLEYKTTNEKKEMLFNAGMVVLESPAIIAKTTYKVLHDQVYVSSPRGTKV